MKYLKPYNESHNPKLPVKNGLSEVIAKWKKFEDDQPCEFDYFWSKLCNYSNTFQNRDNIYVDYDIILTNWNDSSVYNRSDGSGGLVFNHEIDKDYSKKTGYIESYIRTGGYSGGSCWDDESSYARPYETDYSLEVDDLIKFIEHILVDIIGYNPMGISMKDLMQKLKQSNLIQYDGWSNLEYYANSDDYRSYFITLWDLYVFLNKEQVL
jgi:hypothetical protein